MRRPFIAGNWKLNLGPAAAAAHATELRDALKGRGDVDVAVFPSALSIAAVVPPLAGSGIEVGIQEIHSEPSGAFTGANAASFARELGCTRGLIGHSERRQLFGETDEGVRRKVVQAFASGLLPIVCVGETLAERDAGQVAEVLLRQLAGALDGLPTDQLAAVTLAYEPVWAIGTGRTATPDQAQEVHALLRAWLQAHHPAWVAAEIRIQYGGSVTAKSAAELLSCPDVDGALVGGASLKVREFAQIIASA